MNIDSIITEWTYRLPKGYPDTEEDYVELRNVLQEMTDLPEADQEVLVRRAMGLTEDEEDDLNIQESQKEELERDILKYLPGYSINLNAMIDAIIAHKDSQELMELIKSPPNLKLKRGAMSITGIYETLYDIIQNTVKVPHGDSSELWLSIIFNGTVIGASADTPGGVESDVIIGKETVSLKNYTDMVFNFGKLPLEGRVLLYEFIHIAELLTNTKVNPTKTANSINTILDLLDKEKIESDIRKLIKLSHETDIIVIKNLGAELEKFYTLDDNFDSLIHNFCVIIDKMLHAKIFTVNWWGLIIKPTKVMYLETSDNIYNSAKCTDADRLSPAISKFGADNLFIRGSQLGNLGITTSKSNKFSASDGINENEGYEI